MDPLISELSLWPSVSLGGALRQLILTRLISSWGMVKQEPSVEGELTVVGLVFA